jgi:hypothetical protein
LEAAVADGELEADFGGLGGLEGGLGGGFGGLGVLVGLGAAGTSCSAVKLSQVTFFGS